MKFVDELGTKHGQPYRIRAIELTRSDALLLIKSLSSQLLHNNANRDRAEFHPEEGGFFTAIVVPENKPPVKEPPQNMYTIHWKDQTTFGPFDSLQEAVDWAEEVFEARWENLTDMSCHAVEPPPDPSRKKS